MSVFAVDPDTFREVGRITNLTSPRYIHFVSDEKAYVTQIWDNRIFIVNPKRYEITGYIECPDMTAESGSTEQMVQYGKYVFVNCWSYQNRILKIDTETDRIVGQLTVGIQPASLAMDRNNKLWTVTDGGYEGSPYGYEAPSLYRIDAETFSVEKQFRFRKGDSPSEMQLNGTRDTLYWIDRDVWRMPVAGEPASGAPVPRIQGDQILRTDGRSGQRRRVRCPTPSTTSSRESSTAIRPRASLSTNFTWASRPERFAGNNRRA